MGVGGFAVGCVSNQPHGHMHLALEQSMPLARALCKAMKRRSQKPLPAHITYGSQQILGTVIGRCILRCALCGGVGF